jgi:hypothetical protein
MIERDCGRFLEDSVEKQLQILVVDDRHIPKSVARSPRWPNRQPSARG